MIFYLQLLLILICVLSASIIGVLIGILTLGRVDLNYLISHGMARAVLLISGIRVQLEQGHHLSASRPCVYVANHQSAMDIITFGRIFPRRTAVIGKRELLWIPIFGWFFALGGNIPINRRKRRQAIGTLGRVVRAIRERAVSIWVFVEGTRNRTELPLLPFKKGAFYMAIEAQIPIVPVVSAPLRPLVSWKERKLKPGTVRIVALPPISTRGMSTDDAARLSETVREQMLIALQALS